MTPLPPPPTILFHKNGPIHPTFIDEAVRTLIRTLPLDDPADTQTESDRRIHCALQALATLHPRDEIEVMLGVQAVGAYHAAAANWRIGMNRALPKGDSTRHITAAASAARTFDTLLKALERRQAKPLFAPTTWPDPRDWPPQDPHLLPDLAARCAGPDPVDPAITWSKDAIAQADTALAQARSDYENAGLDPNTIEGRRPDGSIVMPENPSPAQAKYIARRLYIRHQREYAESVRNGHPKTPEIRPLRTGDLVP